ncbi:hypothetical protein E2C01_007417 [Portunus trituberculatus]|uniref:Uncharacterized protein n=1 Tax=Portunus trituberculatus TaxID=210409 RepID=A0A5B7CXV8_PORTR|nr:hypothetical protein [Portunus trituberculatus]
MLLIHYDDLLRHHNVEQEALGGHEGNDGSTVAAFMVDYYWHSLLVGGVAAILCSLIRGVLGSAFQDRLVLVLHEELQHMPRLTEDFIVVLCGELEGRGGEGQAGLGQHGAVVTLLVADHLVLPHPGEHRIEQCLRVLLEGGRHNDLIAILKLLQGVGQVRALPGVTRGKLGHQPVHQLAEYLGVHVLQVVLVTGQLWTLIGFIRMSNFKRK